MRGRPTFLGSLVIGVMIGAVASGGLGRLALASRGETDGPPSSDNAELARLYEEDQADRMPVAGKSINWSVVGPRDKKRQARVFELYEQGELRTGKDYRRAAMVLQHAEKPDEYMLAHEFCVVALSKGDRDARWLAAATEDRYLMKIGRPQRFGTQYRSSGPNAPLKLYEVGQGVTDGLRRELGVPSIAQAREQEARMNEMVKGIGTILRP
jgi:hypothetical protein